MAANQAPLADAWEVKRTSVTNTTPRWSNASEGGVCRPQGRLTGENWGTPALCGPCLCFSFPPRARNLIFAATCREPNYAESDRLILQESSKSRAMSAWHSA